jgi:hypothetical protein
MTQLIRSLTAYSQIIYRRVHKNYDSVSKSFRTGRLERELQVVQLSATRCSCIAILWVSLVSFAAITLCVASQWVFIIVSVYFVIDSVRKLLDTNSCLPVSKARTWTITYDTFWGSGKPMFSYTPGETSPSLAISLETNSYPHISL